MQIEDHTPFAISRDAEGAHHASKDLVQVTVTPDLGRVEMRHRVGSKPKDERYSRWLYVALEDAGVYIYVSGTHVVVSRRADYLPTFDIVTPAEFVAEAFRYMEVERDERGRYVVDTENNRRVLARLAEGLLEQQQNRVLAWARHLLSRIPW